ncbi:SR protein-specific kinase Dsk1 [Penicillium angulare]|uniref:SR protein-specific kinase Dsk1 n=1 Tax=Penicillium angulare TaxID=116970 RepID=UPI00254259AE|nr:SR protein-specific kinase Dsk1 [Penicillium angulare]KAJ5280227.1 SR protein-specific kinase Dsk1 [Penicillium angulare]
MNPSIYSTAADIWTLGVKLYEVLGERPIFETFSCHRDDMFGEMVNTLGEPPLRWWKFFKEDGSRIADFSRFNTPAFRCLPQRPWEMGRGETEQTCEWDVAGGDLRALEDMLRAMLAFEPTERPTVDQILKSEFNVVKWPCPRGRGRKRGKAHTLQTKSVEPLC